MAARAATCRPIATHDRVTTFDYDAAGRLTRTTDAAGTVTTTRYDGASRVTMTQTGDRVTRYLYDKDNHKVGVVDPLGYLTEYRYDAGGRLIETVRYSQRSPAAANLSAPGVDRGEQSDRDRRSTVRVSRAGLRSGWRRADLQRGRHAARLVEL